MTYHVPVGDSEDLKRIYLARREHSLDDVLQHVLPVIDTRSMTGNQRVGQKGARTGKTNWTAVHLLSAEEVKSLFSDVVSGLAFLVSLSCIRCIGCG